MSPSLPSKNNYVNGFIGREQGEEEDNNEKDATPEVRLVFFFDTSPLITALTSTSRQLPLPQVYENS
jgi:hypothetical protein